jgi:putative hemolysin
MAGALSTIATVASLVCFASLLVRASAVSAEAGLAAASLEGLKERGASARTLSGFERLKTRPEATFAALRTVLVFSLVVAALGGAVAGATLAAAPGRGGLLPHLAGALAGGFVAGLAATAFDAGARALGSADPISATIRWTPIVLRLTSVLRPPLSLIAAAVDLVIRPLGASARFGPPPPSLEELERMLQEEARRQEIDQQSPTLIRNIFEMSEMTAREVMVPRTEVVAFDIATPPAQIVQLLAEHGHSRMPVYQGDIDTIVGVLHSRDLVPMLQHPELIVVQDVLRPAHFIPWSKPVGQLLREMQKKKIHMALVTDEYGGFMGLVTLEDVLEVIVGDIRDEDDDELPEIEPLPDASSLVRASIPLDRFNESFSVELPEGPYETLGGFLSFQAGCIPETGDRFFHAGLQLTVHDRSARSVRRVRVQRASTPPSEAAGRQEAAGS